MTQLSRTQQAKLAAEIAANAPAPEWNDIPGLKKWKEDIDLKDGRKKLSFDQMVDLSLRLKSEIEYRERIRKDIQTHLEAAMLISEQTSVMCEGYPVNLITRQGSKKLSDRKLMENGVSADVIAASYDVGDPSTFVQIGKPKKGM